VLPTFRDSPQLVITFSSLVDLSHLPVRLRIRTSLLITEACAKHYTSQPARAVGERGIQSLLTQAKFSQIEISPRQLGTYLTLEKLKIVGTVSFGYIPTMQGIEPKKSQQTEL